MEAPTKDVDVSSGSEHEDIETIPTGRDERQRRQVQNAIFEEFLSHEAASLTKADLDLTRTDTVRNELTTLNLLEDSGFASVITDPREYQVELFEKAKNENTIAVLDTGSGKTLIAILLLKHILRDELIDRAAGRSWRTAFFLVDSTALVHQQAAVLKNNIDQTVTYLFGAMGVDLWNKEVWADCVKDNMVVVCTAEILRQCLLSSFVRMDRINLLIFDEAHHTKKDHPYARIIKDNYLKETPAKRPRIFGMTASPIDAKGDVMKAASTLELLLDSKIATASDMRLLRQVVSRPKECLWTYPRLKAPFRTNLYRYLEHQVGKIESLESTFRFSFEASSELGEWCADTVWTYALAERGLAKLRGYLNKMFKRSPKDDGTPLQLDSMKEKMESASEYIAEYSIRCIDDPHALSPKVQLLRDKISSFFSYITESKCIVFTKQRHTARLLCELFSRLDIVNLRPGLLIGVRSGDQGGNHTSLRQQFLTMSKFRKGEVNCLFATAVAEEGLDIPDCNLVVRFDLYDTLIQYIQSRGRARHHNSTYAHMVEADNLEHADKIDEVHSAEHLMRRFCEALPEDRLLRGNDQDVDSLVDNEQRKRTYRVSKTGATLTYHSALLILSRYASSLQYDHDIIPQVHYFVLPRHSAYVCEVVLPEKSPIRGLTGAPATQKAIAKQSAAFDTCLLLRKHGLLDDRFISTFRKRLPAMRNARLAIMSKKMNEYDMITKPVFWSHGMTTTPEILFATIICLNPSEKLARDHMSLLLLTRQQLPVFPHFPVYLEEDIETDVSSGTFNIAIKVTEQILCQLTTFTFRIFGDVFNKTYDPDPETLSYWLAPGNKAYWEVGAGDDPSDLIDWDALNLVQNKEWLSRHAIRQTNGIANCFAFDKWSGKYRYFVSHEDKSLRPGDPPPSYVQSRQYMSDIMNYCISRSKKSRAGFLERCDWKQPVYHAELVSLRRNLLDRMTEQESKPERRVSICLEPLVISSIPLSIVTSCLAFPAVISRFESYLIAREACTKLSLSLTLSLALEALTKDSDNTEHHRAEQIQFERGMGKNYERLEFLGDSFLKMAVTIALFAQNPHDQEFDYHVNRMCLICNRNLFRTAKQLQVYKYIRSRGLSRRSWYPQGLRLLRGKASNNGDVDEKHFLGEKTIADVCEALIGASILSGGQEHRFDTAVKAVTMFVDSNSHVISSWKEYFPFYTLPSYQLQAVDAAEKDLAEKVEAKLGYHFRSPRLLRSAFTHPSYPSAWAKVPCYQRLEFLGDALYDMVCIEDLFLRFPNRDPQWLTEHKMAMVSNKFLGTIAVLLDIHTHLQHFSNAIQTQITMSAEEILLAQSESQGAKDFWLSVEDPPKCLSDMVEAYIGAIFVDSEFQFEVVEDFYFRFIKPYFDDMSIYDTFANKHPTTFLHTRLSNDFGCRDYFLKAGEISSVEGAPAIVVAAVLVHNVLLAKSTGPSGRYAKIRASEAALKAIETLEVDEFRRKYQCNCTCQGKVERTLESVNIGSAV